jgi:hypothetical protein
VLIKELAPPDKGVSDLIGATNNEDAMETVGNSS